MVRLHFGHFIAFYSRQHGFVSWFEMQASRDRCRRMCLMSLLWTDFRVELKNFVRALEYNSVGVGSRLVQFGTLKSTTAWSEFGLKFAKKVTFSSSR